MHALRLPQRRSARLTRPSLLAQVLGVNAALIGATVLTVSLSVDWHGHGATDHRRSLLLVAALLATVLVNAFVLRRRFEPLERLIETMEQVDGADAQSRPHLPQGETDEVVRLHQAFDRMLDRLETERARTASAVLQAQEEERARIARDLHDEANQALTGVLLRLEATGQRAPEDLRPELRETQRAATQAIEELLRLARELRPAALDDHGLAAALRSKVSDFARQTGVHAELSLAGADIDDLRPEDQTVVYRVVQESLSNVAQHANAGCVRVDFARERGATVARVQDDGCGFAGAAPSGHGLTGMRERAALAGGSLDVRSRPGDGTTIELRLGERAA